MSRRESPADRDAETALVGAMLLNVQARERALREVEPDDFWFPDCRAVFVAVEALHGEGLPVDAVTVHARGSAFAKRELTVERIRELEAATPASANVSGYAETVRRCARLRAAITVGDELVEAGYGGDVELVEKLVVDVRDRVGDRPALVEVDDLADLWDLDETEQVAPSKPMVIPGCLRQGEAYILTGSEGGGKMMFLRQVGACVASGIHPLTGNAMGMDRHRVLALDLQEDRVDQAAEVAKLRRALEEHYEPGWYRSVSWPTGVDLLSPRGRRQVEGALEQSRPELVILGPLVKAFRTPAGQSRYAEDVVDEVTKILDELMHRYGFGLMIEAHPGNARGSDEDWRVRGSAVWRSWPAFSHGLKIVSMEPREAEVVRSRPDRYAGRAWPTRLFASPAHRLPWKPSDGDYEKVCRAIGLDWLVDGAEQTTIDVGDEPF